MIHCRQVLLAVAALALPARGAFADPPIDFEPAQAQGAFAVGDLADRKAGQRLRCLCPTNMCACSAVSFSVWCCP